MKEYTKERLRTLVRGFKSKGTEGVPRFLERMKRSKKNAKEVIRLETIEKKVNWIARTLKDLCEEEPENQSTERNKIGFQPKCLHEDENSPL